MSVEQWLDKYFLIRNREKKELTFSCPKCGHRSFYFNISKKVGHCHRASCLFDPTLAKLAEYIGVPSPLEDESHFHFQDIEAPKEQVEINLPPEAVPLVTMDEGKYLSIYPEIVRILNKDRNIRTSDIFHWDIHTDAHKVYVPIYSEGKLVSYIGRVIWGHELPGEKRYKYPSGVDVTQHLFGWHQAKYWDSLVLVENTFNSIWLRQHFNCSTNFGSHLSDAQADKIIRTPNLKSITFLWDEGAEGRAEKAIKKLRKKNAGLYMSYVSMKGQPDDYHHSTLKIWASEATQASREGITCYNVQRYTP